MTIYYEGTFARITDETFESRVHPGQTFPVRELEHPHVVRRTSPGTSWVVVASLLATAAVSAGFVGVGWVAGAPWPAALWVASVAALLAILAIVARIVGSRRRPLELRAVYRGSVVTLLSTRDPLVLGQVSRALLRVIELGDDQSDGALGSDWITVH